MAKKTRATTTTTTSTRDGLVDMGTVSARLTVVRDDGDARRRFAAIRGVIVDESSGHEL